MAVRLEFIDVIIPVAYVDVVYPGGWEAFEATRIEGSIWTDGELVRDGAMNAMDIQMIVAEWEALGLVGQAEVDGRLVWRDFCVVEGLFGGPTLPCAWLAFDSRRMEARLREPLPPLRRG